MGILKQSAAVAVEGMAITYRRSLIIRLVHGE
jgi:hypothetical protein